MNQNQAGTTKKCLFCGKKCFGIFGLVLFVQIPIMYYFYRAESDFDLSFLGNYGGKVSNQLFEKSENPVNISHVIFANSTIQSSEEIKPSNPPDAGVANQQNNQQKTTQAQTTKDLPDCPNPPPKLVGALAINFDHDALSFEDIKKNNMEVQSGGHYIPPNCKPPSRVAIIIPFRNRDEHLKYFLEYMHPIFRRQLIEYQIFIINQATPDKFNRAMLLNVGFKEAIKENPNFDCFAFHDIDLVIQNDKNLYYCTDKPRHLSVAVDKFNYALPYTAIFGGATLIRKDQFELVNGHANRFWGWGGEDDDMYNRIRAKNLKIVRYPKEIARYRMIKHKREKGNEPNPQRFQMINVSKQKMGEDGLNSLKYKVLSTQHFDLYTNVTVALEK